MILVIGDEEVEKKTVALRDRRERKQYNLTKDEFMSLTKEKLSEVHF
jgi:threonyl-tRNA synthetase